MQMESSDQGSVRKNFAEESHVHGGERKQQKRMNRKNNNPRDAKISCTTFNILAPVYKRMKSENCCENKYKECWWKRNKDIIEMLLTKGSSIICLQEFWIEKKKLVKMYENKLGKNGYQIYKCGRPNECKDGLLTAIRRDYFRVINYREWPLQGVGNRVAQLLHVESLFPFWQSQNVHIQQEILLVNTHLMFPHNSDVCIFRLRQVCKIIEYLEAYKAECSLPPLPIILCGDWNGSKKGNVYKFLRSQGFVSSYDQYTESDTNWISHFNHRGEICGVDFIWLLNPNNSPKSFKTSWNEAVFGIIKFKLLEAGLEDRDAFCFFKSENSCDDYVRFWGFYEALQQLNLTGPDGLSKEDTEDLFAAADTDGNGLIDYEEFERMLLVFQNEQSVAPVFSRQSPVQGKWLATHYSEHGNRKLCDKPYGVSTTVELNEEVETEPEIDGKLKDPKNLQESAIGFAIEKAYLFPPEMERGKWPDEYVLSDHAPLTAVFIPVRLS